MNTPKTRLKLISTPRATDQTSNTQCTLLRDVTGSIAYWDQVAEQRYGYSRKQAVGEVSHTLLNTIFPYPLSEINDELLRRNVWKGELIHTVQDGSRVKVLSRWELYEHPEDGSLRVREINAGFLPVLPEDAQLAVPTVASALRPLSRIARVIRRQWMWLLLPALLLVIFFSAFWIWTHEFHVAPLVHY